MFSVDDIPGSLLTPQWYYQKKHLYRVREPCLHPPSASEDRIKVTLTECFTAASHDLTHKCLTLNRSNSSRTLLNQYTRPMEAFGPIGILRKAGVVDIVPTSRTCPSWGERAKHQRQLNPGVDVGPYSCLRAYGQIATDWESASISPLNGTSPSVAHSPNSKR